MSALFHNAVTSIRMGIEDFQTGDDDRMISSARNYYAGLLLLAKECLVRAAPDADPMLVIGTGKLEQGLALRDQALSLAPNAAIRDAIARRLGAKLA